MTSRGDIENMEELTEVESQPTVVPKQLFTSMLPIVVFSYIGVLIRLGLAFLGNDQAPISAAFWTNFVGCFIMGFIVVQKPRIQSRFVQLYTGLTTGLCGSITTFSGIMYESCIALFGPSSQSTFPISNYLTLLLSVFAASFSGFIIGRHLSTFLFPASPTVRKTKLLCSPIRIWLFPLLIIASVPLLITLAVLVPVGHYTFFIYSVIFAPFGSLTRYGLSMFFNKHANFPLGTWLANIAGSLLYLGVVAVQVYVNISSSLAHHIIYSIIQGYCGCLTTVSTFMLELTTINKHKFVYFYFLASILPVQIVYIILGDIFSPLCSSHS